MKKDILLICICFLLILVISCSSCGNEKSDLKLNATVSYSTGNGYIIIRNDDTFSWYNVEMVLNYNEEDLSTAYYYHPEGILPGLLQHHAVWDFRNSDGRQFLPGYEVHNLLIRAETHDGRAGTFVKEW